MHIAIGYQSVKGYEDPKMLYCGEDRGVALSFTETAAKGIARVEVFSHPIPAQRKFFTAEQAPVKVAKKVKSKLDDLIDGK